ncbi:hypothetical protein [Polaromonas sp. YR568]|uniref:hypothetical protein n=1 Tax=Polaromonas sp. YR568 TaxID=1855301 RepID=UPI00398BD00D
MRFLICTVDLEPCPPQNLSSLSLAEALDPALLGITPQGILKTYSWGLGAVLMMWLIGYGIGLATGLIRKV